MSKRKEIQGNDKHEYRRQDNKNRINRRKQLRCDKATKATTVVYGTRGQLQTASESARSDVLTINTISPLSPTADASNCNIREVITAVPQQPEIIRQDTYLEITQFT